MMEQFKAAVRGTETVASMRRRGLTVGENLHKGSGVVIDPDYLWLIHIGDNVAFAPYVQVFAHDDSLVPSLGLRRIAPVVIEDGVFVATRATILPGVRIGKGAAVIAGSVVSSDVPAGAVAGGNPARKFAEVASYMESLGEAIARAPCFGEEWTIRGGITDGMKEEMLQALNEAGEGFVV